MRSKLQKRFRLPHPFYYFLFLTDTQKSLCATVKFVLVPRFLFFRVLLRGSPRRWDFDRGSRISLPTHASPDTRESSSWQIRSAAIITIAILEWNSSLVNSMVFFFFFQFAAMNSRYADVSGAKSFRAVASPFAGRYCYARSARIRGTRTKSCFARPSRAGFADGAPNNPKKSPVNYLELTHIYIRLYMRAI